METLLKPIPNVFPTEVDRDENSPEVSDTTWATWTDRDGEHRLKAKLNRIIDRETVELEDGKGILHRVPLNTLSDRHIIMAVMMHESQLEAASAPK
ncbi:hypothetical protein [Rhodopirellula europaea]|uniref:hypothetical protein n=1 Tax=Rhodopirellula europaea TaxID=1263866 RepID=UPI003D2CFFFC